MTLELTASEAKILTSIIQTHTPAKENEIVVMFLYNRLMKLLNE